MSCTFDGPPILSGGQADGVDAIHDALVVGDCSIGVLPGEFIGFDDLVGYFYSIVALPAHLLDWNDELAFGDSLVTIVAENGDTSSNAHAGHKLFGAFRNRVDQVGAHRFFDIDQNVQRVVAGLSLLIF